MDNISFSTDQSLLDEDVIIRYLQKESYWAADRSASSILRSIKESLCWGVYNGAQQIGFARAVTDRSTVFYLADIFILPEYQNKGLGKRLMQKILRHPDLRGSRGILTTQTAHNFYEEYGFTMDNDIVQKRIMVLANNNY